MRKLLITSMASEAIALVPMAASANDRGADQHFGPFAGTSPDSGTCGNNWATDTFTRNFFVHQNADGSFRVVEVFSNGKFITVPGSSPGACNAGTDKNNGSMVAAGVLGRFGGFLNGTVTGGTYNPHGCDVSAPCTTTAGFLLAVFGPTAKYTCVDGGSCSFFFGYYAADQGLKSHVWVNASSDLGGNRGDIART